MRRLAALVALAVVPLLVVGCSDGDDGGGEAGKDEPAIAVDSTTYSTEEVLSDLRTLVDNPRLVSYFESQGAELAPKKDTINADSAFQWVNSLAHQALIDREFERRQLTTDTVDDTAARASAAAIFGGPEVFAGFPKAFREQIVRRQKRIDALRASFPPPPEPTEAEMQAALTTLQRQCPDGKLISQIFRRDKAGADAIAAELAQGADFATLARERSEETNSGARGGILSCVGTSGYKAYPEAYREAAEALPMGGVSGVVSVPDLGGYFVLKVTPMTLESARPLLESQVRGGRADPLNELLIKQTKAADPFTVAKRFALIVRTPKTVAIVPHVGPVDLSD